MINKSEGQPLSTGKNDGRGYRDLPYWIFTIGIAFYIITSGWYILISPIVISDSFAITGLILVLNSVALIGLLLMLPAFVGYLQMSRTGWVFLQAVAIYYVTTFIVLHLIIPTFNILPELFSTPPLSSFPLLRWLHLLFFAAAIVFYQIPGTRKAFNLKSNDSLLAGTLGMLIAVLELMMAATSSLVTEVYLDMFYH